MKKLLIRADDLGFSEAVNLGILKTVKEGIINNVGLMPNMKFSKHGVELLKDYPICLGQHTNICVGKPLVDAKLIPSLVQSNGEFKTSKMYRNSEEDFVVLDEVILEIEAQYQKFKELTGKNPDYFEGHAISSQNFFKGLEIVANRHHIPYLNISFDNKPFLFGNSYLHLIMDSMKKDYNPFNSLKNCLKEENSSIPMFVCHPGYLDHYILEKSSLTIPRTIEVEMLCSKEIKEYLKRNQIKLVTYKDLVLK